ncbi:carboxypeptidase-like regulatory domain-containing protein [Halobellus limi]|uniref:Carboxypeptidase regulatory-like domain-containing protein n=1 Tax=Halobellus limi TaxID=699433 RepID=A0A1H5WGT5_9EURY|nr:carboxypeptidase-like regulatory domain-containing protein [Halobellus limi]QCC46449.1 carboxypeptidase regulatory-like domain-containing protein [Halobellus limi]SEF98672.1 Carboxypeptidase regulatory-like domain-containing protein [Halobellus limi]
MRRLLALIVVLSALAFVPVASATTTVGGTVTVDGGSADGARVEVVPLTEQQQRTDDAVTTTVEGTSFSVEAPDAPAYAVRIEHEGATHYEVLQNRTRVEVELSQQLSGRVVDADGTAQSGAVVELIDENEFVVDTKRTNETGAFAFGPLEPDETYELRTTVGNAAYRRTVDPSADGNVTVTALPPTNDTSVLGVANRTPTGHVVQIVPPANDSEAPSVVETIAFENPSDRPFLGTVTVGLPADASAYAAMVDGSGAEYRRTDAGVELNVSVPANGSTQVGAAYDLTGTRFEKEVRRNTTSLAVVLQGYDPSRVRHSSNLRTGSAPIPLLTTNESLATGTTISVDVAGARTNATGSTAGSDSTANAVEPSSSESGSIPSFPGAPILAGVFGAVAVGLGAYRATRPE